MAIVADRSGNTPTDHDLTGVNRKINGTPIGSTTPGYRGEIVMNYATGQCYRAVGATNNDWQLFNYDAD